MTLLIGIALAAAAPAATPMTAWAQCVTDYARPRMATETVEQLTDGGLAACAKQESVARQSYVRDFGKQKGDLVFTGVKVNVRKILMKRFADAKRSAPAY